MSEREQQLETALRNSQEALVECMSEISDLLNRNIGRHLYKKCHNSLLESGKLLTAAALAEPVKG